MEYVTLYILYYLRLFSLKYYGALMVTPVWIVNINEAFIYINITAMETMFETT